MLITSHEQLDKIDELANIYLAIYPNIVANESEAKIYANAESSGTVRRTVGGIVTISSNAVSYEDNAAMGLTPPDFSKNWMFEFDDKIRLSDAEYMKFISDLSEFIFSASDKILENFDKFSAEWGKHYEDTLEELERIESEILLSESITEEITDANNEKVLHIMWVTEEGILG